MDECLYNDWIAIFEFKLLYVPSSLCSALNVQCNRFRHHFQWHARSCVLNNNNNNSSFELYFVMWINSLNAHYDGSKCVVALLALLTLLWWWWALLYVRKELQNAKRNGKTEKYYETTFYLHSASDARTLCN